MPELAEVEFFRKQWNPGLKQKILSVHLRAEKRVFRGISVDLARRGMIGQTLLSSHAHGKQMLFRIGPCGWLGIHLGMTGKLSIQPARYAAGPHDHLILRTADHCLVFCDPRLFGRIRFHRSPQPPDWWTQLPPAILSSAFDGPRLVGICHQHRKTSVKSLLLRQDSFPGIGNWMADEILWQTRIHPRTLGDSLSPLQIQKLYLSIRKVSREAMRMIGKDWSDPPRSWLFLHRWKTGRKCPRCHRSLARDAVSGRTTCWCPGCQPLLPRRKKSA